MLRPPADALTKEYGDNFMYDHKRLISVFIKRSETMVVHFAAKKMSEMISGRPPSRW